MFHRVKTIRLSETGTHIEEFWGTKEEPADLREIALRMLNEHPHGVIEMRYVR
jgi:hypothetical protein